jgi:ATP-dependent Clp protease protease subunit
VRIFITGNIEEEACKEWVKYIISSTDRNVYIYLDSLGGDGEAAIHFASFLRASHRHVTTVVTGSCMSAAMIILAAGKERWAISEASFMLHPASDEYEASTSLNQYEMAAALEEAKIFDEKIYKASIAGTSLSIKTVVKKIEDSADSDWKFGTKEAQQYGIITNVGTPFEIAGSMLETNVGKA